MTQSTIDRSARARLNMLLAAAKQWMAQARHWMAQTSASAAKSFKGEDFNGRWTRRHWAQASLFAALGMLLAAIVPGFSLATQPLAAQANTTSMALSLPPLSFKPKASVVGDSWRIVTVQSGQTLGAVFEDLDIPAATMYRLLDQPGARETLVQLRPGDRLAFDLPANGQLRAFRYDRDDAHRVQLTFNGDAIKAKVIERPVETRTVVASGEIESSLYTAARQAGLSPATVMAMTDAVFQYDVDFSTTQKGDRFSVIVDETWREGERISGDDIVAATFTTHGKTYSGFRFEYDGKTGYYTADGRPLKKAFIRMPIPYARITSNYSPARRHPISGRVRPHEGVDYGASRGTPIHAAGAGRIKFEGWQRGYGRTIIVDHGKGYSTLYAHMSRFAKYKRGQSVGQGTVIGYVGSSGAATGPHLHYEFRINGQHRNPLTVTMPPPEPLKGEVLARFQAQTAPVLARLERIDDSIRIAAVDTESSAPQG